jgi:hypothetical protein
MARALSRVALTSFSATNSNFRVIINYFMLLGRWSQKATVVYEGPLIKIYPFALRLILVAFAAVWPCLAKAQPYDSHWQAAMQASSARLRLFALMAQRPDGAADAVAALQKGQGFAHIADQGPQILSSTVRVGPVLRYDSNINGGTPGETISIGGLPFSISPETRAVSGIVWGGAVSGSLRLSLSPTTILDANLSASRAQGQGAMITTRSAALCLGQYLGGSDWLDLCLARDVADRALSHNDQTSVSIGLTQQFATDFALSEAQIKLRQTVVTDYQKLSLDLGLSTARARWGLLETRAELGQYIAGEHTRLFGATLSLTRPVLGTDTVIFASYSREGGASFFGDPRWDQVVSLGLSRPITDVLGLNLSLQDRQSTLANYDGVTWGLDFTFQRLTF